MEELNKINWSWNTVRVGEEKIKYYDTTFTLDERDIFYCHLNQIEPEFLSDVDLDSEEEEELLHPIDPRNNKRIEYLFIDNSTKNKRGDKPAFFKNYSTKSSLSKEEHIEALNYIKENLELSPTGIDKWNKENQSFQEFLKNYELGNFEHISRSKRILSEYYLKYLVEESEFILSHNNTFYALQTAIPFHIKNIQQNTVNLTKPTILLQSGHVPKFDLNLKNYSNILKQTLQSNSCNDIFTNTEFPKQISADVFITENTLLMLLDSSKDLDTWEVEFNIINHDNNRGKMIVFEELLPIRSLSVKNFTNIFEKMLDTYIETNCKNCYSLSTKIEEENIQNNEENLDIQAVNLEMEYKPYEHDEYIKNILKCTNKDDQKKSNFTLNNWILSTNSNDEPINVVVQSKINFYRKDESDEVKFVNTSIKLEQKVEFGAEIMTLPELIKEWLRSSFTPDGVTERIRIDVKTQKKILQQSLSLTDIEQEMDRLYNIKPQDLLTSLYSLLSLILTFPNGSYFLKYNPKHEEKIMVYTVTENESQNTISLHDLYDKIKTKTGLLKTENFIPIDSTVITPMHEFYKILPCCFPYWIKIKEKVQNNFIMKQHPPKTPKSPRKKQPVNNKQPKFPKKKRRRQKKKKQKNIQKPTVNTSSIEQTVQQSQEQKLYCPTPDFNFGEYLAETKALGGGGNVKQVNTSSIEQTVQQSPEQKFEQKLYCPTPDFNFEEYLAETKALGGGNVKQVTREELKVPSSKMPLNLSSNEIERRKLKSANVNIYSLRSKSLQVNPEIRNTCNKPQPKSNLERKLSKIKRKIRKNK